MRALAGGAEGNNYKRWHWFAGRLPGTKKHTLAVRRPPEAPGQGQEVLLELGRAVDVEVDAEHGDAQGEPVEVVVARAVLAGGSSIGSIVPQ